MQGKDPFFVLLGLFILTTTFFFCGKGAVTAPPSVESENPAPSPPSPPNSLAPPPSSPPASPTSGPPGLSKQTDEWVVGQTKMFRMNSASLLPEGKALLNGAAAMLRLDSTSVMDVGEYMETVGQEQANPVLLTQRAQVVAEYLIAQGIAAERVIFAGEGLSRVLAEGATGGGRWPNQHTELSIGTEGAQP